MTGGWREFALILTIVAASGFADFRIRQFPDHAYTKYIPGVVDGTYGAPAIYRVLVPFSNTWMADLTGASPATIWHITRLAWFLAAFMGLFHYLRHWLPTVAALGGVCAVAATLPLTYTNSWAHADSVPELALFTLGCQAIVKQRPLWLAVVLVPAALNRETAAFLVAVYAISQPVRVGHVATSAFLSVICVAILGALRLWRGVEHYDYWQLWRNLEFLKLLPAAYDPYKRAYAWFIFALVGPALAVLVSSWAAVPWDARRLVWGAIPVAITGLLFSSLIEPRIFLPLYPLLLPALMCAVVQPKRSNEESALGT